MNHNVIFWILKLNVLKVEYLSNIPQPEEPAAVAKQDCELPTNVRKKTPVNQENKVVSHSFMQQETGTFFLKIN